MDTPLLSPAFRRTALAIALAAIATSPLYAAEPTPVGRWLTYSDKTLAPNGVIEIKLEHGALTGTVIEMLNRTESLPPAICRKCRGALKNAPVIGMTILWGLKKSGGASWEDGSILDPNSGDTYSASIELEDGGRKLRVRGYLGISLLGRTKIWIRQG